MPRIGQDEWVASDRDADEAATAVSRARRGNSTTARTRGLRLFAFAVVVAAVFPFVTDSDFLVRVGVNVLLVAMLAIGLNITVGWAGMLDLGYVAFYGFGAYAYAFVSSDQFGLHWPTELTMHRGTVLATALLGLLLGLPSRRLIGDYLAIITLFFAQMFVEITTNLDRLDVPWSDEPLSITGGPNGHHRPRRLHDLRHRLHEHQPRLLLPALIALARRWSSSTRTSTGRARAGPGDRSARIRWRPRLMSVPVNRLKLLAFVFGAATAGLAGTVFAAVQAGTSSPRTSR